MPQATRSIYALAPASQKVRLVLQVSPNGWSDEELEKLFAGLIPVLGNAAITITIVLSANTAFVVRYDDKSQHFDIDEVDVAEVLSPVEVADDPSQLFDCAKHWLEKLVAGAEPFVSAAALPKRVPEMMPLLAGAQLRDRAGSIGIPSDRVTTPEKQD